METEIWTFWENQEPQNIKKISLEIDFKPVMPWSCLIVYRRPRHVLQSQCQ